MPIQELPPDVRLRAIISDIAYACHKDNGVEGKYSGDRAETKLNQKIQRAITEGDIEMAKMLSNCRIAKQHCNQNTVTVVYIHQNERTNIETREVIIGCRGTNPISTYSGLVADRLVNYLPIALTSFGLRRPRTTIEHVKGVMKDFGPQYQYSVTGHSLGGSTAEKVSWACGIPGHGFNGASGIFNRYHNPDFKADIEAAGGKYVNRYTNYCIDGDRASMLHLGKTVVLDPLPEFSSDKIGVFDRLFGLSSHSLDNFTRRRGNNDNNNNIDPSLGGVDFSGVHVRVWPNHSIDIGSISGAVFSGFTATLLTNKHSDNSSTITKQDFAVALALAYHGRDPAFSLDPWEPTKPDGPWLRCVYYPEQIDINQKNLPFSFAQTDYGRTMFEADWLLKQLSMGVNLDGYTTTEPFPSPLPIRVFPPALVQLGFRDRFELENSRQSSSSTDKNPRYTRLWITVQREETLEGLVPPYETFPVASMSCSQQMDLGNSIALRFSDVKLGVQVMRMAPGTTGELQDVSDPRLSDPNSSDVIFARLMTDHYDEIAHYYPSLRRLKELAKLQAIAKWMMENDVHVDIDEVLKCIRESTSVAIEKVPALERQTSNVRLFGGVNLSIRQNYHERAPDYSTLGQQNQTDLKNLIRQSIFPATANENGSMVTRLPFIKKKHCSVCDRPLDFASLFKPSISPSKDVFCNEHHPDACYQCMLPLYVDPKSGMQISEQVYLIQEGDSIFRYHQTCFLCDVCDAPIADESYRKDPDVLHVYYHLNCYSPIRPESRRNTQRRHDIGISEDDDEQAQLEMILRQSEEEYEAQQRRNRSSENFKKHDYYQNQIPIPSTLEDEDIQLAKILELSLQTNQSAHYISHFPCSYCGNEFRTRDDLDEHIQLHFDIS